ncbi:heme ABC transporter ATP-binding protein [Paeniglutamicibacter sp. NPDC012692]|uniref:heme ABC transporter ATP-binding protein n=1 Tax=Paeniglutamicibacter sp. NPDC012692 TaxID=3364388 RepID=UPI003678CA04
MSPATVLQAHAARLAISGRPILDGIDLELYAGEVVALVGPNGAGKSTLLAALCGDVSLDSGSITLHGLELPKWSVKELARARSVQMQDAHVSFAFSARDVVRMGRAPWAGSALEERDDQVIDAAMHSTESTALAPRVVPTLSGGERARVAFARALAQETRIIMLDEPTAAMDIRYQELLLTRTRERAAAGATAVVVLHDLSLAAAYADRIVLLHAGSIRMVGTPREVLRPEILEEVYRHKVAVIDHPESGGLAVVPLRPHLNTHQAPQEELV